MVSVDASGQEPRWSCGRCGKWLSEHQLIRATSGPYCLACVLYRYRRGDLSDRTRIDISVDLLTRVDDGIL